MINTHRFNVLIVDDTPENIQVAMNILKEDNYDLSFATDGEEALELVIQQPEKFHLILLDIMMPKKNGYDVCKILKENVLTRNIPIIFLTAKTDVDSISKGFSLGAADYISKPFYADELLARVKNHVGLYHAQSLLKQHNIDLETKVTFAQERFLTELEQTQRELIYMLTELMEANSDETGKHIKRVAEMSALLAKYHPALTPEDAEVLRSASPMHDIGKMTIDYEVLNKPGRYTEEEFLHMQTHTTNAYNLLKSSPRKLFKAAAIIAHEHHEKWNGKGYPRGISGTNIHIYGRIVALADVFDALTHVRCYKDAWTAEEALEYIKDHDGTQFDPELIQIFVRHFAEFKKICLDA